MVTERMILRHQTMKTMKICYGGCKFRGCPTNIRKKCMYRSWDSSRSSKACSLRFGHAWTCFGPRRRIESAPATNRSSGRPWKRGWFQNSLMRVEALFLQVEVCSYRLHENWHHSLTVSSSDLKQLLDEI